MKAAFLALLLLATFSPAAAQGDPASPVPSEGSNEYRQLVQQALDEFERGNWDEAAGLFQQAHQISPSARTLRGMGLAAFEGRRYVASLDHLRAALSSTVNPLTDKQRAEVEETIARAEKYVAKLQLTVTPESAELFVNGEPLPGNGGDRIVTLDPGLVEIRATSPGHQLMLRQLRMVSGAQQHLELRLSPSSAIAGAPGRQVDSGRGGFPYSTFGWLSVGLAGGSAVGSLIAWQARESAAKDYNRKECRSDAMNPADASTCDDLDEQVGSAETAIAITAVASGVFVGAAVLFFVLDGTDSDDGATALGCSGGPGELGLQCNLTF